MESSPLNATPLQPEKKPYQKPSLKVYGDIRTLTGTSSHKGTHFDVVMGMVSAKTH